MKTIRLFTTAIIFLAIGNAKSNAQVAVNINIGVAPAWGPVGYDEADYYYLPDVESYYDVRASRFIYFGNGQWVRTRHLPRAYRNYDLYSGYKVVLADYRGNSPYVHYKEHRVKYYKGYRGNPQRCISYRPARRVAVVREHGNKHNHGNGHGHGGGRERGNHH